MVLNKLKDLFQFKNLSTDYLLDFGFYFRECCGQPIWLTEEILILNLSHFFWYNLINLKFNQFVYVNKSGWRFFFLFCTFQNCDEF